MLMLQAKLEHVALMTVTDREVQDISESPSDGPTPSASQKTALVLSKSIVQFFDFALRFFLRKYQWRKQKWTLTVS